MEIIGLVDVDVYRRGLLRCCDCHWTCVRHGWVRTSALLNMLREDVYVHAAVDACPSAHASDKVHGWIEIDNQTSLGRRR